MAKILLRKPAAPYDPPPIRVTLGRDTSHSAVPRAVRRVNASVGFATKGRTNGMPWTGVSPCTESTVIDAHTAPRNHGEFGNLSTLVLAWKYATTRALWWELANKMWTMADEIDDDDLAGDLNLLAGIAYRHGERLPQGEYRPWWV